MALLVNRTLTSRSDMIGAIRALQQYLGQPVCSQIDDQALGQQVVKLQKYLATVPDASQPSGFKLDPTTVRSNIADHSIPGAIVHLQAVAQGALPFFSGLSTATTTRMKAGYNAMIAGTRNMNIAIMGDSTERGVDETAVPYNSQYPLSAAEQLARLFRSSAMASGANNWYGISGNNFNDYMIRDSRVSATGSATAFNTAVPCQGGSELEFPTATGTFNFTPQQPVNTADIYYQDSAAGRQFSWAVDGGGATTITTTGVNTIVKLTIPLGAVGTHTIQLAWIAQFVRIYGIDAYDNTRKEVTIRQWGISGGTSSDMVLDTGTPSSGRLRQLALFPVDLAIGDMGLVNSWRNSRSIANCQTDIAGIIAAVQAAGGDFIFCTPPFDSGSTGATASQQAYIDAVHTTVLAAGASVFNIRTALGSKANSDALGYTSAADAVHWTIAGQAYRAGLILPALKFGMGL
jgi:hypothetical protein